MPDIAATYTLNVPTATDIVFNNGGRLRDGQDYYWLTSIEGLDGPPIRAPIDNRPQTDGGLVHDFYLGPRHIIVEGFFLIQSTEVYENIRSIRNDMEAALLAAHMDILRADGTWSWTPLNESARSLTVRGDVPVQFRHIDNYRTLSFAFGLVAADPTW